MAINFPTTPSNGDVLTSGGTTWRWNATKAVWEVAISGTISAHVHAASDITSGTLTHERGGLEADVSSYSGFIKITGGATSQVAVSANGESLITAANYAAMRALLDLEPGTDFLAFSLAAPLASPALTGNPTAPTASLNDNDTSIATTAFVRTELSNIERDTRTGTSETLALADAGQFITLNNASPITLTIPANASVAFPVGTRIDFAQLGAGQVTFAITSDTLRSSGSKLKLTGQYSGATIYKLASTEWILIGDIAA